LFIFCKNSEENRGRAENRESREQRKGREQRTDCLCYLSLLFLFSSFFCFLLFSSFFCFLLLSFCWNGIE